MILGSGSWGMVFGLWLYDLKGISLSPSVDPTTHLPEVLPTSQTLNPKPLNPKI